MRGGICTRHARQIAQLIGAGSADNRRRDLFSGRRPNCSAGAVVAVEQPLPTSTRRKNPGGNRKPKRKLKGQFLFAYDATITVEFGSSRRERIEQANVRNVWAEREAVKHAPVVGTAAGATVFGVMMAKVGEDLVPCGKARYVGIGAQIGALSGWGAGALGRHRLVYRAHKRRRQG